MAIPRAKVYSAGISKQNARNSSGILFARVMRICYIVCIGKGQ